MHGAGATFGGYARTGSEARRRRRRGKTLFLTGCLLSETVGAFCLTHGGRASFWFWHGRSSAGCRFWRQFYRFGTSRLTRPTSDGLTSFRTLGNGQSPKNKSMAKKSAEGRTKSGRLSTMRLSLRAKYARTSNLSVYVFRLISIPRVGKTRRFSFSRTLFGRNSKNSRLARTSESRRWPSPHGWP